MRGFFIKMWVRLREISKGWCFFMVGNFRKEWLLEFLGRVVVEMLGCFLGVVIFCIEKV